MGRPQSRVARAADWSASAELRAGTGALETGLAILRGIRRPVARAGHLNRHGAGHCPDAQPGRRRLLRLPRRNACAAWGEGSASGIFPIRSAPAAAGSHGYTVGKIILILARQREPPRAQVSRPQNMTSLRAMLRKGCAPRPTATSARRAEEKDWKRARYPSACDNANNGSDRSASLRP